MAELQEAPVQSIAERLSMMVVFSACTAGATALLSFAAQWLKGASFPDRGFIAMISTISAEDIYSGERTWKVALLVAVVVTIEIIRESARADGFSLLRVLQLANFKEDAAGLMRGRLPALPEEPPERNEASAMDLRLAEDTERANERMRLRQAQRASAAARKED